MVSHRTISLPHSSSEQLQSSNDFAEREYTRWNDLLKQQLPIYIDSRVIFIDPVFRALMNFQLRMFSQMLSIYQEMGRQFDLSGPLLETFEKRVAEPREALMALRIIANPMGVGIVGKCEDHIRASSD